MVNSASTINSVPNVWMGTVDNSGASLANTFVLATNVSGTLTEQLRVDGATGNVSMGSTSSSVAKLYIVGSSSSIPIAQFSANGTSGTSNGLVISAGTNTSDAGLNILGAQSGTSQFKVRGDGFVGVNNATPNFRMSVVDTQNSSSAMAITNLGTTDQAANSVLRLNTGIATSGASGKYIRFCAGATADNSSTCVASITMNTGNVAYNTTGGDFAEAVDLASPAEEGDIISGGPSGYRPSRTGESIIGVVSKTAGFIGNIKEEGLGPNQEIVGFVGRIKTKVSTLNGPILFGDPIAATDIPGVGAKSGAKARIVGSAEEAFDPANGKGTVIPCPAGTADGVVCGTIIVHVAPSTFDSTPDLALQFDDNGNLILPNGEEAEVEALGGTPNAEPKRDLGWTLGDFAKRIKTLEDRVASGSATTNTDDSTRLDALTDKLSLIDSELSSLKTRTTSLEDTVNLLATASAMMNEASGSADLSLETIDTTDVTISNTLSVGGRTTLSDVGITGKMNIGLLSVEGLSENGFATLNTTSGKLHLQSDGVNGIDILDGKIVIEPNGNMKVNGTVTVKKLNVDIADTAGASLGTAIIPAGTTTIDVTTTALTDKSKIFVTGERPTAIGAKSKDSGTFTITVQAPPVSDLKVNWWIVN
jgi:hypothetical protein